MITHAARHSCPVFLPAPHLLCVSICFPKGVTEVRLGRHYRNTPGAPAPLTTLFRFSTFLCDRFYLTSALRPLVEKCQASCHLVSSVLPSLSDLVPHPEYNRKISRRSRGSRTIHGPSHISGNQTPGRPHSGLWHLYLSLLLLLSRIFVPSLPRSYPRFGRYCDLDGHPLDLTTRSAMCLFAMLAVPEGDSQKGSCFDATLFPATSFISLWCIRLPHPSSHLPLCCFLIQYRRGSHSKRQLCALVPPALVPTLSMISAGTNSGTRARPLGASFVGHGGVVTLFFLPPSATIVPPRTVFFLLGKGCRRQC